MSFYVSKHTTLFCVTAQVEMGWTVTITSLQQPYLHVCVCVFFYKAISSTSSTFEDDAVNKAGTAFLDLLGDDSDDSVHDFA